VEVTTPTHKVNTFAIPAARTSIQRMMVATTPVVRSVTLTTAKSASKKLTGSGA